MKEWLSKQNTIVVYFMAIVCTIPVLIMDLGKLGGACFDELNRREKEAQ
jgi:hypothetical protein